MSDIFAFQLRKEVDVLTLDAYRTEKLVHKIHDQI